MNPLSTIYLYIKRFFKQKQSNYDTFEPLEIRGGVTLKPVEYMYAFKLQLKHSWLENYSCKLESTIQNLLKEKQHRVLFSKLLKRFIYVDRDSCHKNVLKIVHQIDFVWKCDPDDSVIVAVKKTCNTHPDGSNILLYNLQDELKKWKTKRFLTAFDLDHKRIKNSRNIILCDDFIGSGETIANRISDLYEKFEKNKRVYVVSLGAMKKSKERITRSENVSVYSPVWVSCGLNHKPESCERLLMLQMEKSLAKRYKEYELAKMSLGYNESGALYFNEEFRIPNNVYPIFWWGKLNDGNDFDSIFLRS